jgi:hypothetical protein
VLDYSHSAGALTLHSVCWSCRLACRLGLSQALDFQEGHGIHKLCEVYRPSLRLSAACAAGFRLVAARACPGWAILWLAPTGSRSAEGLQNKRAFQTVQAYSTDMGTQQASMGDLAAPPAEIAAGLQRLQGLLSSASSPRVSPGGLIMALRLLDVHTQRAMRLVLDGAETPGDRPGQDAPVHTSPGRLGLVNGACSSLHSPARSATEWPTRSAAGRPASPAAAAHLARGLTSAGVKFTARNAAYKDPDCTFQPNAQRSALKQTYQGTLTPGSSRQSARNEQYSNSTSAAQMHRRAHSADRSERALSPWHPGDVGGMQTPAGHAHAPAEEHFLAGSASPEIHAGSIDPLTIPCYHHNTIQTPLSASPKAEQRSPAATSRPGNRSEAASSATAQKPPPMAPSGGSKFDLLYVGASVTGRRSRSASPGRHSSSSAACSFSPAISARSRKLAAAQPWLRALLTLVVRLHAATARPLC